MGGTGSGRRARITPRQTTDDYRSIDVRWLTRAGVLRQGERRHIRWTSQGRSNGAINVLAEAGRLVFSYRQRDPDGDWKDEAYPVIITTTACALGGERYWFRCPARGCGRRVAILYAGAIFACRKCYRLTYASKTENEEDRIIRKANRIRARLGWTGGMLEGYGPKPDGMHWKTFDRLEAEHKRLVDLVVRRAAAELFPFAGNSLV